MLPTGPRGVLLALAQFLTLGLDGGALFIADGWTSDDGADRTWFGWWQLHELVVLQQVANNCGSGRLTDHGGSQHHLRDFEAVALDEAGRHCLELLGGGILGVIGELLDAIGEAFVGENERQALHRAVEAALGRSGPHSVCVGLSGSDELVERVAMFFRQCLDNRHEGVIGHVRKRAVEQPEGLEAGLHLIHGIRRYRRNETERAKISSAVVLAGVVPWGDANNPSGCRRSDHVRSGRFRWSKSELGQQLPMITARARQLIGLIDLTNLDDGCDVAAIDKLCAAAVEHQVAAVCVWPDFVAQACSLLAGAGVRVATVVNFPTGDERAFAVASLTATSVDNGADEIDVVLPYRAFAAGEFHHCADVLRSARLATAGTAHLKVILETGELVDPDLIAAASRFAIDHGADFIKTSTGKSPVSATPAAVAIMLDAIAESDRTVGIKPSGGIRTAADAERYVGMAEERLGVEWPTPHTFRFGASSLLDVLLNGE